MYNVWQYLSSFVNILSNVEIRLPVWVDRDFKKYRAQADSELARAAREQRQEAHARAEEERRAAEARRQGALEAEWQREEKRPGPSTLPPSRMISQ